MRVGWRDPIKEIFQQRLSRFSLSGEIIVISLTGAGLKVAKKMMVLGIS